MEYKWRALGAVMLGSFMGPFDATVANVALPAIGKAFSTGVDSTEWVLLSYLLATASTLAIFGRFGDMLGAKRVYVTGFAVFGASSLACALSPNLMSLIIARAVQGVGAAMLMSTSLAIITQAFPAHQRGRAIGMNGAAVAFGLTSGPIAGGFIVSVAAWHWIFLINVPISIVGLFVAARVIQNKPGDKQRFDVVGSALISVSLFCICLALSRAHIWGWAKPPTIGVLVAGCAAFAIFLFFERRVEAPTIDLRMFEKRIFAFSVLAAILYFCASYSVVFTVPLAAQVALHLQPLQAGLLLVPISMLNVVLAPVAGMLSDRIPARYISTAGAAVFTAGAALMIFVPAHPSAWTIAGVVGIAGLGSAVFTQPNNSTIMGSAPENRRGVAAGILATARTSGQVLGVAIAGAIYFFRAHHAPPSDPFAPARAVFIAVAALMLLAGVLSYNRE
ncbi:MAG TPA: MFS transporter [Candidatus Baltobacteraceae bacterium]|jgi:EmrB/QacA subfamily drug resistance transporter|nr:MFS transporter [Candidatus Baltobacteraceae bacterium]